MRLFATAAALVAAGCAAKQRVPLDACVTDKVVVYVDDRLLEADPASLELATDVPHKVYIKRPGEKPVLVVLEPTQDGEGRPRLEPADPCKEVVAVGLDRKLTIEVDDGPAGDSQPAKP
ncbi:MAG TPA: hypothetical protein VMS55_20585 [Myxococcota bacterium]|nr:hypothetical protein [Myxococcota bacterium]